MTMSDIIRLRLSNQMIAQTKFSQPGEVVEWLGAVQAQDYAGSLWGIGLRLPGATKVDVERAVASKTIVRTWPMRGTLHFAPAEDVRWMLRLLTPRILAGKAGRYRQLELTEADFRRARQLFEQALVGKQALTRAEMYDVLERGKVSSAGQRGIHILARLAQEGLICFGPHRGNQPTFVLLDEWLPNAKDLSREEALAKLAGSYFASHGPATLKDFVWWSGLKVSDAKSGLELVQPKLAPTELDGQIYWMTGPASDIDPAARAYLLPPYDEYTVGYKDRKAILDPAYAKQSGNGIFSPVIIIEGRIAGTWGRSVKKDAVIIKLDFFTNPTEQEKEAAAAAAERYAKFSNLSLKLITS